MKAACRRTLSRSGEARVLDRRDRILHRVGVQIADDQDVAIAGARWSAASHVTSSLAAMGARYCNCPDRRRRQRAHHRRCPCLRWLTTTVKRWPVLFSRKVCQSRAVARPAVAPPLTKSTEFNGGLAMASRWQICR